MPIVPSIQVSQSSLTPANVTLTDNSTGTDAAIASRRVYFQTNTGSYLKDGVTTDYNPWSYADASKTFNILTQDMALFIKVEWLNVGNTVIYTFNDYYPLTKYNKNFAVYLGELQAITPGILQDANYAMNMAVFWAYIQYSITMITEAADISNSQNLMDKATFMRLNESKFF